MEREVQSNSRYYHNSRQYLEDYYGFTQPQTIENDVAVQFILKSFNEFCGTLSSTGLKVLEFGGGPSILPLISLSQYADEIVFTDYDAGCRKEVELWINQSPEAFDWSLYFNEVVKAIEEIQTRMLPKEETSSDVKFAMFYPAIFLLPSR